MVRPRVFIGSSTESLRVAHAIHQLLDHDAEVKLWANGVFGVGGSTLQSLMEAARTSDFAVMVLHPEDVTFTRNSERSTARDNVIFEMGLFLGRLGRERCFMVYDRTNPPSLPSDLLGVTPATYQPHADGNLVDALGAAASSIREEMERQGIREERLSEEVGNATRSLADSKKALDRAVFMLARSRAVELEIISSQFGSFIDKNLLLSLRQDLEDLLSLVSLSDSKQ